MEVEVPNTAQKCYPSVNSASFIFPLFSPGSAQMLKDMQEEKNRKRKDTKFSIRTSFSFQ